MGGPSYSKSVLLWISAALVGVLATMSNGLGKANLAPHGGGANTKPEKGSIFLQSGVGFTGAGAGAGVHAAAVTITRSEQTATSWTFAIPLPSAIGAEGGVMPVSMTMQCVINLTVQYFAIYTALAICRTYRQLVGGRGRMAETVHRVLESAERTVAFGPMLCVLFLAARMRALQLTHGKGSPQAWVQAMMQICTWAVLVQTAVVFLMPLVTGSVPDVDEDGNLTPGGSPRREQGCAGYFLAVLRVVVIGCLYGGFVGICVGIITMQAPKEAWPEGVPKVSPAVSATINLSIQYFAVYLALLVCRTLNYLMGRASSKAERVMKLACYTVNFAPMLCILFIGARMRALQIDPKHGNPQPWAQSCFYLCAYSVLVQTLLVVSVPLLGAGEAKMGSAEGDVDFVSDSRALALTLTVARYLLMFCLYGGFTAVIVSVILIENPDGPTPPISPTMQCVMNLTVQFFAVYLVLWVCLTVKQFSGRNCDKFLFTLENARGTVQFCPMLSVLFVGTRMRALQISDNKGEPQGWAQDAMFLCSFALLLQLVMVLVLPMFTGEVDDANGVDAGVLVEVDADGVVKEANVSHACAWVVTFIRYTALLALYGGVAAVIASLFLITHETANGRGALIS